MTPRDRDQRTKSPLADLEGFDKTYSPAESPAPDDTETVQRIERKYRDALELGTQLSSTLELDTLLGAILDGILRVTECERALLMLKEPDGAFSLHVGRTRDGSDWGDEAASISRTIVTRVADSGEAIVESNLANSESLRDVGSIHEKKVLSVFCLPLAYKGDLVGVIYADSKFVVPQVLESDHTVLSAFCAQAALAIANARRHGELQSRRERLEEQNISLRQQLSRQFTMSGMVTRNKNMLEVFEMVRKIGPHDINVLVQGESGTGKELIAHAIHEYSNRSDGAFQVVNCTSIPGELFESELFGHVRGAFTGAIKDRAGRFEQADGGTLFLDEIGDMPLEMQPKLLRAIQQGTFSRVGEDRERTVDVRIVAATNRDLQSMIEDGRFREDLYYRLSGAKVSLPPLRERREDILPLAEFFLEQQHEETGAPLARLSDDARRFMLGYPWGGNVRQLQSAIKNGIAFQDENHVIHAAEIERHLRQVDPQAPVPETGSLKERVERFEEEIIRAALAQNDQNVTATARELGISRQQLHNKIRKFGISTRGK